MIGVEQIAWENPAEGLPVGGNQLTSGLAPGCPDGGPAPRQVRPDMNETTNEQAARGGTDTAPLLRLQRVSKNFGPVQALVDVDFDVPCG